jgi:carbon storage regulator
LLVLTRRVGEAVKLGEEITVRVLGISGGQIRLGFDAPKATNIVRTELLEGPKARPAKE